MARVCLAARLGSYGLNAVRVRTSARYHGYGAYFTFLWHNAFNNVLPDPSLIGLGLACETILGMPQHAWRGLPSVHTLSSHQYYTMRGLHIVH